MTKLGSKDNAFCLKMSTIYCFSMFEIFFYLQTLKVSMLKDKCVAQPQYYNNKELCKVLGVKNGLYKNTESKDCSPIQKLVISTGTANRMSWTFGKRLDILLFRRS